MIHDFRPDSIPVKHKHRAMEMRQTYARVKSETRDGSLNEIHDVVRACALLLVYICLYTCMCPPWGLIKTDLHETTRPSVLYMPNRSGASPRCSRSTAG